MVVTEGVVAEDEDVVVELDRDGDGDGDSNDLTDHVGFSSILSIGSSNISCSAAGMVLTFRTSLKPLFLRYVILALSAVGELAVLRVLAPDGGLEGWSSAEPVGIFRILKPLRCP